MTTETPAPLVVAHHNGWSANYGPTDHRGYRTAYTTVTGYGDRFADFIGPGTTFVDARTAPDDLWTWFAIAGPIPCAALEPDHLHAIGEPARPWANGDTIRSLTTVGRRLYATMAAMAGATITEV